MAILDSLLRALHQSIQSIGIPAYTTYCTTLQNTRLIYTLLGESKKGGGLICADLPARMVGERPNGAQRRLLGHADVPSCGTPMLSDRCSLNIRKKAISLHFCSLALSLSLEISRGMNSLLNTPSWPQLPGLPRALNMDFFSQLVGRPTSDPPLRWPGARKSETGGGEAAGN